MPKKLRLLMVFIAISALCACGGGGSGSSSAATAGPTEPPDTGTDIRELEVLDALPATSSVSANPAFSTLRIAHLGNPDLSLAFGGDCNNLVVNTLNHEVVDLAVGDGEQLLDHRARCSLEPNTTYTLSAESNPGDNPSFRLAHEFSTGVEATPGLTITDAIDLPRSQIDQLFSGYVEGALLGQLDAPSEVENLLANLLIDLAEENWSHLVNPDALYDVRAMQVSYVSRTPDGSPSTQLSGLVSMPVIVTASQFVPREQIIVLTHATGSTPSELSLTDAWFILANLFASRGYLVIAPDNFGRGGTTSADETYLLDYHTAQNSLDLVEQVIDDPDFDEVNDGSDITIIGYSQGGHSAIGLWKMIETQGPAGLNVKEVYAGGAPHNLYQTFRGVLQFLDGSCDSGAYCRYVDAATTVPFATDRILPGLLSYTESGMAQGDLIDAETINPIFISGFLKNEAEYDRLKLQLQLNSFTGMVVAESPLAESEALIHLYHSAFDRLVPSANTEELAALLSPAVTVDFHESRCNSPGYELLFNLTDKVGVLHTLCGLAVLDDVMNDLR